MDDVRLINRLLAPILARVQLMIGRFVIEALRESPKLRTVQLSGLADETLEGVELFQQYGFASSPKPGAEAIGGAITGLRDHTVVLATADRRYKVTLDEGEVAIHDDLGQKVHLKRTGVVVETPLRVDVDAVGDVLVDTDGKATVDADGDVDLVAGGDVNITGATDVTIKATAGAVLVEAVAGATTVKASGDVEIDAGGDATINAGGIVNLGGTGGAGVARIGDTSVSQVIVTGSSKVFSN